MGRNHNAVAHAFRNMFDNNTVQKALKKMVRYTVKHGKESGCNIITDRNTYTARIAYGRCDGLADSETEYLGNFYEHQSNGGHIIFETHTHPGSPLPCHSLSDLKSSETNMINGVSVVQQNLSLETLLWVPLGSLDAETLHEQLIPLLNIDRDGFPISGNKEEIVKTLNQYGKAAFLTFEYRGNYSNGCYVPRKESMSKLLQFAPLLRPQLL